MPAILRSLSALCYFGGHAALVASHRDGLLGACYGLILAGAVLHWFAERRQEP